MTTWTHTVEATRIEDGYVAVSKHKSATAAQARAAADAFHIIRRGRPMVKEKLPDRQPIPASEIVRTIVFDALLLATVFAAMLMIFSSGD